MNKAKLTALCHKISKNTGLTFNSVMTYYFLEVILKKLKVIQTLRLSVTLWIWIKVIIWLQEVAVSL